MNIVSWIIFGVITGISAHMLDSSAERGGLLGTILLGVLGALVGGLLANVVVGTTLSGFNLVSFALAIFGSLILLFIQKMVRRTEGA